MTAELQVRCLEVENWTRSLVINGLSKEEIVARIDEMYEPLTDEEMEAYSEAIIYSKYAMLN
mgnify:CR=1 FL=1